MSALTIPQDQNFSGRSFYHSADSMPGSSAHAQDHRTNFKSDQKDLRAPHIGHGRLSGSPKHSNNPSGFTNSPPEEGEAAEMSSMREHYRRSTDDEANADVASQKLQRTRSPQSSSASSSIRDEWRHGATASGVKRRHSQRSPSRPRSQQGSQMAQIATIREAERENNNERMIEEEEGALFQHGLPSGEAPRKNPRIEAGRSAVSSVQDEESIRSGSERDLQRRYGRYNDSASLRSREEPNYTWRHQDDRSGEIHDPASGVSPSARQSRLPALSSGEQVEVPAIRMASGAKGEHRRYDPSNSPPSSRLPGVATLGPYQYQRHGESPPPYPPHHQRTASFGALPQGMTSPRAGGPSNMSAPSPSLSQTSHTTPGQAFIHPSLAGLPGSGGGAGSKQQPSFVSKLYSMLEDDTIEDMIAWGLSGTTFSVANPAEFAKVVLPNWFKHSNWQSFVRQLNMYGFHKVNHTYQGTPEEEIQIWEFKHPSFRRGEVHLLNDIKRKSSRHKRQDSLTRGIAHLPPEYDMGSPSPDMKLGPVGSHGHFVPHAQAGYGGHPGRLVQAQQPYARSIAGPPPPGPYREYVGESHSMAAPPPPSIQHSAGPSGGGFGRAEPVGHPSMSSGASGNPREAMHISENVNVRIDDLSDRIDAIIRHASYLESQLRTASDQMYHSQQNEASLRAHVHHLEAQMRSLSDQMLQQRQGTAYMPPQGGMPGQRTRSPPPPPPPNQGPPQSPSSSSLGRLRQPPGAIGGSGGRTPPMRESGRFQLPPAPSSQHSGRSPVMGHRAPPPPFMTQGRDESKERGVRGLHASSADAYTSLGPGSGGRSQMESP